MTSSATVEQLLRQHGEVSHADLMEQTGQPFDVVLYELDTLNAKGSEAAWRLPEVSP